MTNNASRSATEQTKVESEIRALFEEKITFNQFLGFKVEKLNDSGVVITFPMQAQLIGHFLHGRLHGGVISSALDATGGLAVLWAIAQFQRSESATQIMQRFAHLGTVDLRVDYLRQGIGDNFIATAEVIKLGRRIASTRMQLHNTDGVLISSASATYIVS